MLKPARATSEVAGRHYYGTMIKSRCRRCGEVLTTAAAVLCAACLTVVPAPSAVASPAAVLMRQQHLTAVYADRPDLPHTPERDFASHVPSADREIAPPPVMGAAELRGEGRVIANGTSHRYGSAVMHGSGSLAAG